MKNLKRYFITGLIAVVPVVLTIYVLVIVFQFTDSILGRFINIYFKKTLGFYVPGLGFLIFLIVILLSGFLANKFIGKKIFPYLERWFSGLPLIKNIYPTLKQIIRFMLGQKEFGFKKVVLVEYPSKGIWSIGFLTNEHFGKINQEINKEVVSVFLPTSPSPFTGYVVFIAKEEVRFLDIPISEALKIIISGGAFNPI